MGGVVCVWCLKEVHHWVEQNAIVIIILILCQSRCQLRGLKLLDHIILSSLFGLALGVGVRASGGQQLGDGND